MSGDTEKLGKTMGLSGEELSKKKAEDEAYARSQMVSLFSNPAVQTGNNTRDIDDTTPPVAGNASGTSRRMAAVATVRARVAAVSSFSHPRPRTVWQTGTLDPNLRPAMVSRPEPVKARVRGKVVALVAVLQGRYWSWWFGVRVGFGRQGFRDRLAGR